MSDDLVAFLEARLDETAAKARAAKPGPWHADGGSVYATHPTDEVVDYTDSAEHIAHHNPARVLAEVDAKRQLLDEYVSAEQAMAGAGWPDMQDVGRAAGLEVAVQLLALSYADHPDYRPEWRP